MKIHGKVAFFLFLYVIFIFAYQSPAYAADVSLNRYSLVFGAVKNGNVTSTYTGSQTVTIYNNGTESVTYAVYNNSEWLSTYPSSGVILPGGYAIITVSVGPCGYVADTYTGSISIDMSSGSPISLPVAMHVLNPEQDANPFGIFDTPFSGSTVRSSIPVTGWALDDVKTESVKIYSGATYIGDATMVEGSRPDVEALYPDYPVNYNAGWGYMMLTNFLPGGGNGTYNIRAVAEDTEGNQTTLGTKTIYCDNANSVKPFGAIDTPAGETFVSGSTSSCFGWALTPQPGTIPIDGSTIDVWIDGTNAGHPSYNKYRSDIAELFPNYNNSDGAGGIFLWDTTAYSDGVHCIYWSASDTGRKPDGIGSRYFTVSNSRGEGESKDFVPAAADKIIRGDYATQAQYRTGYDTTTSLKNLNPDINDIMHLTIQEGGRIEVHLNETGYRGYHQKINVNAGLPTGSTLDSSGVFS